MFRNVFGMFWEFFYSVFVCFNSVVEANVLRLEPLRGNLVDSSPRILSFCDTESLYEIYKYYEFLLRFSEKLAFIWNFNLGKYELGNTKEIDETSWGQSQYIGSKN